MPKKQNVVSMHKDGLPQDKTLGRGDHLELMRHEHAVELARVNMQLAQANDRAVRLEITLAAKAASDGIRTAQDALRTSTQAHRDFAESLAARYAFAWSTHTYCPDTGIVRRVPKD
jgi:hypothetical protein